MIPNRTSQNHKRAKASNYRRPGNIVRARPSAQSTPPIMPKSPALQPTHRKTMGSGQQRSPVGATVPSRKALHIGKARQRKIVKSP